MEPSNQDEPLLSDFSNMLSHFPRLYDFPGGVVNNSIENFLIRGMNKEDLQLLRSIAVLLCRYPDDRVAISHIHRGHSLTLYYSLNRKAEEVDHVAIRALTPMLLATIDGEEDLDVMLPVVVEHCKEAVLGRIYQIKVSLENWEVIGPEGAELAKIEATAGANKRSRTAFNRNCRVLFQEIPTKDSTIAEICDWISRVHATMVIVRNVSVGHELLRVMWTKVLTLPNGGKVPRTQEVANTFINIFEPISRYAASLTSIVGYFRRRASALRKYRDNDMIIIREVPFSVEEGKYDDRFKTAFEYFKSVVHNRRQWLKPDDVDLFCAEGDAILVEHPLPRLVHQMLYSAALKLDFPKTGNSVMRFQVATSHIPCLQCCVFGAVFGHLMARGIPGYPKPYMENFHGDGECEHGENIGTTDPTIGSATAAKPVPTFPPVPLLAPLPALPKVRLAFEFYGGADRQSPTVDGCRLGGNWKVHKKMFPVVDKAMTKIFHEFLMTRVFDHFLAFRNEKNIELARAYRDQLRDEAMAYALANASLDENRPPAEAEVFYDDDQEDVGDEDDDDSDDVFFDAMY